MTQDNPSVSEKGTDEVLCALRRAGEAFFLAAALIFMGIITGEVLYPRELNYNAGRNDISDLGGTLPPEGMVYQPAASVFDSVMILGGLLVLLGAHRFRRAYGNSAFSSALYFFGAGALGVGIFPGNVPLWHPLFAMLTFFSGGIAAVLSRRVIRNGFGWIFAGLGSISLFFLILNQSFIPFLGSGGTERWVAYPIILWLLGFGGYLAGAGAKEPIMKAQELKLPVREPEGDMGKMDPYVD
jgi:hypothetical membrane protein